MEYRRLGRSELQVSVVGFGTCQLRLVPEKQAIETLLKGFALGVNIIHTAPDYGNAEEVVARAVRHTESRVIVASQGYDVPGNTNGPVSHFEKLFETTCERLGSDRLDLYGIACIDDREIHRENVWGRHGMIEFLLRMKEQGRLGGIFCTTHGAPDYVSTLVTRGVFDAVMIAYNVLGYHLLSYPPPLDRQVESLPRNQQEIFPLCREHDVGVMIMKPLGGGLLCDSKAFPPRHIRKDTLGTTTAGDMLRAILTHPEVACVVPGTASVEEAEQNALSGHGPIAVGRTTQAHLADVVTDLRATVCSRCGACDALCSQHLAVSSIFWAGLFHQHPSAVFEQPDNIEYFRLHPHLESICSTCPNITCTCPAGIDIPGSLTQMHSQMLDLMRQKLIPPPDGNELCGDGGFGARIVSLDVPKVMESGRLYLCRLLVENAGERGWHPGYPELKARVALGVFIGDRRTQTIEVTQDVHRGGRWHFTFEVTAPLEADRFRLRLQLLGEHQQFSERLGPIVASEDIVVRRAPRSEPVPTPVEVPRPYDVAWLEHNLPSSFRRGEICHVYLRVENRGARYWHAAHPENWVEVVVYIGGVLHRTARLPGDVPPGRQALLTIPVAFPDTADEGKWTVTVSFVEQNVAWFHDQDMAPLVVDVRAEEPETGAIADACAIAKRSNWGMWQPGGGIARSRTGRRYPVFLADARGCRVRDAEGNEWMDYVMAGGSALLGYANPEIQAAIARQLASSAVLTLAHMLEITVTKMLCDTIPCAEMVLFGKHGSDMCTAAIRTARLHTGRRKVLFSGYHGWHDWYVETLQPRLKASEPDTLFRFDLNDLGSFQALIDAHRGEIAAVIVEPAAQASTLDGPTREADPVVLRQVADLCHEQGGVLIFDEIVTGFRYPHGSVQRATGVIPDLACFGKALSGGMPLSALVGKRRVMETALQAAYMPTFRGEVYSLAAAEAALEIHAREDIPARIDAIGRSLKEAVNGVSRDLNVQGALLGVPFRMIYVFDEPDTERRVVMRTILQQELLQRGVLTYKGFMLPSIAHGALDIEHTVSVFKDALTRVQEISADRTFVRHLEIPWF
jgi:glutamate-1-semialdehyde 2,1-aminomutase